MPVTTATTIDEAQALLADAPSPVVAIAGLRLLRRRRAAASRPSRATHAPDIAVLVVDDGGVDRRFVDLLDAPRPPTLRHDVVVLHHADQPRLRALLQRRLRGHRRAATSCSLNSDVVVGPEWLERLTRRRLQRATRSPRPPPSPTTARSCRCPTATARPLAAGRHDAATEAARRVAAGSLRLRPSIPTAIGHCFYVRRARPRPGRAASTRRSAPATARRSTSASGPSPTASATCAPTTCSPTTGAAAASAPRPEVAARQERHEAVVRRRYPWYAGWVARRRAGPGVAAGRRAGRRPPVAARPDRRRRRPVPRARPDGHPADRGRDAPGARPPTGDRPPGRLRAAEPAALRRRTCGPSCRRRVRGARPGRRCDRHAGVVDLVYRPYQVTNLDDLDLLDPRGRPVRGQPARHDRLREPGVLRSPTRSWLAYRDLTRLTLELAHGVAFLSDASRRAAEAEGSAPRRRRPGRGVVRRRPRRRRPRAPSPGPPAWPDDDGFLLVHRRLLPAQEPAVRPADAGPSCAAGAGTVASCSPGRRRRTATRWPARPSSCSGCPATCGPT